MPASTDKTDLQFTAKLNMDPAIQEARKGSEKIERALSIKPETKAIEKLQQDLTALGTAGNTAFANLKKAATKYQLTDGGKRINSQIAATKKDLESLDASSNDYVERQRDLQKKLQALNASKASLKARGKYSTKEVDLGSTKAKEALAEYVNIQNKAVALADKIVAKNTEAANKTKQKAEAQEKETKTAQESANATEEGAKQTQFEAESARKVGEEIDNNTKKQQQFNAEAAKQSADKVDKAKATTVHQVDLDADVATMSYGRLLRYIAQVKLMLKEIDAAQKETNYTTDQYDDIVEKATNKLNEAKQAVKDYGKETKETGTKSNEALGQAVVLVANFTQQIAPANSMLGTIAGSIQRIGQAALQAGREAATALAEGTAGLSLILTIVAEVVNLVQTAAAKIVDSIKSVWNTIKSILSKIADAIKKIISLIMSLAKTVIDHLKKAFDDTGRSSSNIFDLKNWRKALQLITKYVFGFRSFFFLYRRLRKGIADGLKNLVQFEGGANETNHAITELRTSLLYLKNAWAAAFAPVINAVYPILVQLMDMLAAVGNAIARFIAALTGQATVLQAVRVGAGDYAQSLADAGSSAGDAAKKQEELNDRLAEFDDLNVLGRDKDKTSPSGGGGGGGADDYNPNVNDMFVRIETPMNDLAKRLRELWEQGDFYGIGNFLATELSNGMARLAQRMAPGGDIYNKVMEAGRNISDLLDGILDVEDLGSNFGKLFGNAVVLGIDFLEEILTPDKFLKLGTHIANAMNEAIPLIVPKLGEFFGLLFTDAITGWYGWVTNADFARWGESIAQGLNNFLEQMNMTRVKGVLGKVEPLNAWQMLGIDITETVQGMIDMLGALIAGADWHALGEGIGQLLSNIDFGSIWEGLVDTRGHFLSGLSELWGGFSETGPSGLVDMLLPFIEALQDIPELLNTIKETLLEVFGLDGLTTTEKKVAFVRDTIQSIGEFISELPETLENLVETLGRIADVVERVFEFIGDTNADARENANSEGFWEDFVEDIRTRVTIGGIAEIIGGPIVGSVANIITTFTQTGNEIGTAVANGVEDSLDDKNPILGYIERNARDFQLLGIAASAVGEHFLGMSPNIGAVAISLKDVASEAANVKGAFETTKNAMNFDTVDASLRATAETAKTSLSVIPDKFTEIKSVADTQSGDMKTKFTTAFDTIKQSSDDSSRVVSDSFTTASDNIKTSFIGAWDEIKASISEGGDLFTALSDGLGNTMKALLNAMIQGINISITKPLQDISSSFNVLRTLDVNGSKPFATIPVLRVPTIPYLAQGAVIPPNKEFMAVLGDQSHGTNIEAPLDTIRQAVGEEFAPYSEAIVNAIAQVVQAVNNKNLVIGDREIGKANARYESQQALIRGTML